MSQEYYAFGANMYDDCGCPALYSSYEIGGLALQVAEHYDQIIRERYEIDEGVVPASVAKSCWQDAIEKLDDKSDEYEETDIKHSDYLHECARVGEDVMAEVF